MPFEPGERLKYSLRWNIVPAGEAVLEVLPMKSINGIQVYHFRMTAESNSFVDIFYKVRDLIDSYADNKMTHSVRYLKKQHEGNTKRNVSVELDWNNNTAYYKDEKKSETTKLLPGAFDPLGILYYSRILLSMGNESVQRPVTDGSKCIQGRASIIKRERIEVASGSYDTLLLEPEMEHIGGVFEKSKGAKIKVWVTADHRFIPVKIASKVVVGSFVAELVAIE
ncbi:MAG: DUF3108 domain-containing protein [Pseudomonadota bacterium]